MRCNHHPARCHQRAGWSPFTTTLAADGRRYRPLSAHRKKRGLWRRGVVGRRGRAPELAAARLPQLGQLPVDLGETAPAVRFTGQCREQLEQVATLFRESFDLLKERRRGADWSQIAREQRIVVHLRFHPQLGSFPPPPARRPRTPASPQRSQRSCQGTAWGHVENESIQRVWLALALNRWGELEKTRALEQAPARIRVGCPPWKRRHPTGTCTTGGHAGRQDAGAPGLAEPTRSAAAS